MGRISPSRANKKGGAAPLARAVSLEATPKGRYRPLRLPLGHPAPLEATPEATSSSGPPLAWRGF